MKENIFGMIPNYLYFSHFLKKNQEHKNADLFLFKSSNKKNPSIYETFCYRTEILYEYYIHLYTLKRFVNHKTKKN